MRRRYPVVLGALALVLVGGAAVLGAVATELAGQVAAAYRQPLENEEYFEVMRIEYLTRVLVELPAPLTLAAVVAGVGALVLVVLRARDQWASDSATAPREASAAASRS